MTSLNWSPSAWFLAQTNHVLAGCLVVVAAAWQGWEPGWAFAGAIAAAALKEFVLDLGPLEHDTWQGSLGDWTCYALGALAGWLAVDAVLVLTVWDIASPSSEPQ
jgi:hypothetical protein